MNIDDAGLAVGILLEANHRRAGAERVARKDRRAEATVRVTQVGDGVERDVRHRLAEHDVEHQQVVDRRPLEPERARELVGGMKGEAAAGEADIERDVALRHGARRRVPDLLAEPEILEEVAGIGLHAAIASGSRLQT